MGTVITSLAWTLKLGVPLASSPDTNVRVESMYQFVVCEDVKFEPIA